MGVKPATRKRGGKPQEPISLTDREIAAMSPYLQRASSAQAAFRSAQESLNAIALTIAGRAGADPSQKFTLDLPNKRLVPQ